MRFRNRARPCSPLTQSGRPSSCSNQYPVTGNTVGAVHGLHFNGWSRQSGTFLMSSAQPSNTDPVPASPYPPTLPILPFYNVHSTRDLARRMVSTWSMCQLSSPRSAILHHRVLPLGVRQCHIQEDVRHRQLPSNFSKEKTQRRCFMNFYP